jgi:hypothetical protein
MSTSKVNSSSWHCDVKERAISSTVGNTLHIPRGSGVLGG